MDLVFKDAWFGKKHLSRCYLWTTVPTVTTSYICQVSYCLHELGTESPGLGSTIPVPFYPYLNSGWVIPEAIHNSSLSVPEQQHGLKIWDCQPFSDFLTINDINKWSSILKTALHQWSMLDINYFTWIIKFPPNEVIHHANIFWTWCY